MTRPSVIDTGVLVAMLDRREAQHAACVAAIATARPPLVIVVPVVMEACHLLPRPAGFVLDRVCAMVDAGRMAVHPLTADALPWIAAFQRKYANLRPDFADAAVCWIAEQRGISTVLTLDRDFTIYRRENGEPFDVRPGPVD